MLDNSDPKPLFLQEKEFQDLQIQNTRMFRRHFIFWSIRWTIGFLATIWFVSEFPQHKWVWGITIGFASLSLLIMIIGNRLITKKTQNSYIKMTSPYSQDD